MRIIVECPVVSVAGLRERAHRIARQLGARTPERRAMVACWVALAGAPSLDSAYRALRTFGSPQTQAAAAELLDHLAEPRYCAVAFDQDLGSYACSTCGAAARPADGAHEADRNSARRERTRG